MAGSYPDVPSRRIPYDADGTVVLNRKFQGSDRPWMELDANLRAILNGENPSHAPDIDPDNQGSNEDSQFAVIFPELREFDGLMVWHTAGTGDFIKEVETSADTTNAFDGTWSTAIANYVDVPDVIDTWRDNITSLAVSSIRAIRFRHNNWSGANGQIIRHVHFYGEISPGETSDRVLFIDETTGLEFTLPVDFGDVPRGSSEEFEWRIKNNSASLQANNLQYTSESLYRASGAWYTHTLPGGSTYQSTRQVTSLGAGSTTALIKTLRVTPGTEALGLHAARTRISVDTWT